MRKWLLISMLIILSILVACSGDNNDAENNMSTSTTNSSQSEEIAEDHVRITISINDGSEFITEEEIQIEEGDLLLDVMEENFYIEHEGGFITSIERVAASDEEKTAWMFFVNDEMPSVGAADLELTSGDKVEFDLQPWE